MHVRAIIIGCSNYKDAGLRLSHPTRDATGFASALRAAGADVTVLLDPSRADIYAALEQVTDPLRRPLPEVRDTKQLSWRIVKNLPAMSTAPP